MKQLALSELRLIAEKTRLVKVPAERFKVQGSRFKDLPETRNLNAEGVASDKREGLARRPEGESQRSGKLDTTVYTLASFSSFNFSTTRSSTPWNKSS